MLKKFRVYGPPIVVNCDISSRNMDGQAFYPMYSYIDFMNYIQIFNTCIESRHETILVKNATVILTVFLYGDMIILILIFQLNLFHFSVGIEQSSQLRTTTQVQGC